VWQEFPLSSSGLDNDPPDEEDSIDQMATIAESYVRRRRNHVSLTLWCGGNELQTREGKPLDRTHPMLARLGEVVARSDPSRRYVPTSSSGPNFSADEERFGQGVHWDVHGPWRAPLDLEGEWREYWERNDALFHSEVGAPGASPAAIIGDYKGDLEEVPGTAANPLWRRTSWWIEWPTFVQDVGREPGDLEEYVRWSQDRQQRALSIAARSAKKRFPRCGGFLIWMGHDSFPCTANTSIVDFDGKLKPAGEELARVYREESTGVGADLPRGIEGAGPNGEGGIVKAGGRRERK
jgi:beta-mannosidase